MENKKIIELKNISVSFDGEPVLKDLNLSISDGEFVTLLGPSGCGKTTTLRIIGGFIEPDSGDVLFDGKRINGLPAYKRSVNTIFQRYALFPHLNVYENVAFGMRVQKKNNREIEETVARMLKLVNLVGFEKRAVSTLSGGQQQRVAIARALANTPKLLLADEPTGNLDPRTAEVVFSELLNIVKETRLSAFIATHNFELADKMDRKVRLQDGRLIDMRATKFVTQENFY